MTQGLRPRRSPPLRSHDPLFLSPGAEAFKRDNPKAEVKFFDTGHFALETHVVEIGAAIDEFLGKNVA
jgi:hypothetical protein